MGKRNIGRTKSKKRPQGMSRRQRIAGKKKQRVSVKKRKPMTVKSKGGQRKQKWGQAGVVKSIRPTDFFDDATKPLGFAQKWAKREKQKLF